MLKIVIDATPIAPKPSGVGFYVASLIHALSALQSQEEFSVRDCLSTGLQKLAAWQMGVPDCLKPYPELYFLPLPVRAFKFTTR
jgi:hypothetical protein